MRGTLKQVIAGVFGLAFVLVILEHAGGFSSILAQGGGTFSTAYQALTGHAGGQKATAAGYVQGGSVHI